MDKIIEQAIRRKSKPGLALFLVDAMHKRGQSGVPVLIAKLLQIARQLKLIQCFELARAFVQLTL